MGSILLGALSGSASGTISSPLNLLQTCCRDFMDKSTNELFRDLLSPVMVVAVLKRVAAAVPLIVPVAVTTRKAVELALWMILMLEG